MLREVTVEVGRLRGIVGSDPNVAVFRGVPFARPPIGAYRWRAPLPVEPWDGVRPCWEYGPVPMMCSHPGANKNDFYTRELNPTAEDYPMSEDCLYLNIFTPAREPGEKLPVLCYIHGGGFTDGYNYECEFNGERLARRGIVVVMISYRLGLFGFLAHPQLRAEASPGECSANFGLYDQSFALHWTRRNIAAFGGDPEQMTVCGQSAGSCSAQIQSCSPLNAGLLKRAIFQSSVSMPFADEEHFLDHVKPLDAAERDGQAFMESIGIKDMNEARLISAEELLRRIRLRDAEENGIQHRVFTPCIDGGILPCGFAELNYRDTLPAIPVLTGHCMAETQRFMGRAPMLPTLKEFKEKAAVYGSCAKTLLDSLHTDDDVAELYMHGGYNRMIGGTRAYCRLRARKGLPTYYYIFDHDVPGDDAGSFHGSELWFMFDSLPNCWRPFEGRHYDLARQAASYWLNFIKTGDPNGVDYFGNALPVWPSCTTEHEFAMRFSARPQAETLSKEPAIDVRTGYSLEAFLQDDASQMS